MSLLTLAILGCGWESIPIDEPHFYAHATLAWGAEEALVLGEPWLRGGVVVLHYTGGRMETVYRRPDGYVAAADRSDAYTWFVFGVPKRGDSGSEYVLMRSADRGRTWSVAGPVPFGSMSQLVAVSDHELWIHATDAVGRSTDGGVTWDVVHAPGTRNGVRERLVAQRGEMQLLGDTSYRSFDGGETWESLGIEGRLVDSDDGWYLGELNEQLVLWDPERRWRPLPWTHPDARPLGLRVDGDSIQVLTTDIVTRGILRWFESRDRGRTWRMGGISAQTFTRSWTIAPDGALFAFPHGGKHLMLRRPLGGR